MAINKIRQYGARTIPTIKDKVTYSDIINDTETGGTAKPASAEMVKQLKKEANIEIADRVKALEDLIGGATSKGNTLKKLENSQEEGVKNNNTKIAEESEKRDQAISAESLRASTEESILKMGLSKEVIDRKSAFDQLNDMFATGMKTISSKIGESEDAMNSSFGNLNGSEEQDGSVDAKIKKETNRAKAEEARIEKALQSEITARTEGTALKSFVEETVATASTKAANDNALNTQSINEEAIARAADIAKVDANIVDMNALISSNKTSNVNAIKNEATARMNADTSLSDRLNAVEGTLTSGVAWKGSVQNLDELDKMNENSIIAGQAYYVHDEKDVYVVLEGTDGDYKPTAYTKKSFLKIADFTELSGLVAAEKNRALASEAALNASIDTEIDMRGEEISRVENIIKSEVAKLNNNNTNIDAKADRNKADLKNLITLNQEENINSIKNVNTKIDTEIVKVTKNTDTKIESLNTNTDVKLEAIKSNLNTTNTKIDVLNADAGTAGSVASKVKVESDRATASEKVLDTKISNETADRKADIDSEEARATNAEKVLDDKIIKEVSDRNSAIAIETTNRKENELKTIQAIDVLNADKLTSGSIAKAQFDAQAFAIAHTPSMKLEGMDGNLKVQDDKVIVMMVPMQDSIVFGEVIVYNNNGEAIAVNVASYAGKEITLDVTEAGEFDGYSAKIQYMHRDVDQENDSSTSSKDSSTSSNDSSTSSNDANTSSNASYSNEDGAGQGKAGMGGAGD